jgi:hypothetical protein
MHEHDAGADQLFAWPEQMHAGRSVSSTARTVSMTTTQTYIKAQQHTNDLLREAQRRRRHLEVRRVAVIRPEGAHFKLRPIRASLQAAGG